MDEVNNYKLACEAAGPAIQQDYYNEHSPFKGSPAAIPMQPCDTAGNSLIDDVPYEYIELEMPDADNRLAVLLPITVANGPGRKFRAHEIRQR